MGLVVKKISGKNLLFRFGAIAVTIYPSIYINRDKYNKLRWQRKAALFEHENLHWTQQRLAGKIWFLKYIFSKKFRFSQEVEAYLAEYRLLSSMAEFFNADKERERIALALSSKTYLGMVSHDDALRIVSKW